MAVTPRKSPRERAQGKEAMGAGEPAAASRVSTNIAQSSPRRGQATPQRESELSILSRSLSQPPQASVRRSNPEQTAGGSSSQRRTPGATPTRLDGVLTPGPNLRDTTRTGDQSIGVVASERKRRQVREEANQAASKRRKSNFGLGGLGAQWAKGEESPLDLLRMLSRAEGFRQPDTPPVAEEKAEASASAGRREESSAAARSSISNDAVGAPSASEALALGRTPLSAHTSADARSGAGLSRRSSTLQPGRSVPGDLTRDDDTSMQSTSSIHPPSGLRNSFSVRSVDPTSEAEIGQARRATPRSHRFSGLMALARTSSATGNSGERSLDDPPDGPAWDMTEDVNERARIDKSYTATLGELDTMDAYSRPSITSGRASRLSERMDVEEEDEEAEDGATERYADARRTSFNTTAERSQDGPSYDQGGEQMDFDLETGRFDENGDRLEDADGEEEEARELSEVLVPDSLGSLSGAMQTGFERREQMEDEDEADYVTESDQSLDDENGSEGMLKVDTSVPPIKRKAKKKKRVSPHTGVEVPNLSTALFKDLFSTFLNPGATGTSKKGRIRLDKDAVEELDDAVHDFLSSFSQDIAAEAMHSGRSSTIYETDVEAVLKAQGLVTSRNTFASLARKLLPRELSDLLQPTLSGTITSKRRTKRPSESNVDESGDASTSASASRSRSRPNDSEDDIAQPTSKSASASRKGKAGKAAPRTVNTAASISAVMLPPPQEGPRKAKATAAKADVKKASVAARKSGGAPAGRRR